MGHQLLHIGPAASDAWQAIGQDQSRGLRQPRHQEGRLLATGEIRLPNGKIIGHRDYKHIYRQRTRLPDQREAIVINKLALEYRKAKMEENGVVAVSSNAM